MFGSVNDEWSSAISNAWGTKLRHLSSLSSFEDNIDLFLGSCFNKDLPWVSQLFPRLPMILYFCQVLLITRILLDQPRRVLIWI